MEAAAHGGTDYSCVLLKSKYMTHEKCREVWTDLTSQLTLLGYETELEVDDTKGVLKICW